jgi:carbon storage regulator CsrA
MLILTRKDQQKIVITCPQGDVVIKIMDVKRKLNHVTQVRIGLDAPKEFVILRDELINKKRN